MAEHRKYAMAVIPFNDITIENICGSSSRVPVIYWAPRREEIQRFVEIAKAVHTGEGKPRIIEVGCGTGFLAYLLAATGEVDIIGLDPNESLVKNTPYLHPNLSLKVGDSEDAYAMGRRQNFDVVLNSWMPLGLNLTPDIRNIGAKAIIYAKESGSTGILDYDYREFLYEDGFDEGDDDVEQHRQLNPVSPQNGISNHPGNRYRRAFEWFGPACSNIQDIAPMMRHGNYGRINSSLNCIDIQLRNDIPIPEIPDVIIEDSNKYCWEADLDRFSGIVKPMERYEEFSWLSALQLDPNLSKT